MPQLPLTRFDDATGRIIRVPPKLPALTAKHVAHDVAAAVLPLAAPLVVRFGSSCFALWTERREDPTTMCRPATLERRRQLWVQLLGRSLMPAGVGEMLDNTIVNLGAVALDGERDGPAMST